MKKNNKFKLMSVLKSKVIRNSAWLYFLQIFNTVIPLITLPYITRILGPSQYGIFSSALNLVGYFQVVVEYGFNLSGARKVAISNNKKEISDIYSRITFSKILLLILTFCGMLIFISVINVTRTQIISMLILYLMVFGSAIQQTWLFHGLQEMKYITIVSVISRTISVILIFIFINNNSQVYQYSAIYSLTLFFTGVFSVLMLRVKFNIRLQKVKVTDIIAELKDGWYLFTTSAMTKIFSGIGITVLIFTSSEMTVGIYSAIQKIPIMLIMIYTPISQVFYPYVSKQYISSFASGINIAKKLLKLIMIFFSIIGLMLILNSKMIINIVYGIDYSQHFLLLAPLVFWMILSILNNVLGIQILVASGHQKQYSKAFHIGVIAMLLFNITFGGFYGMYGVAIASMLAELILTIAILVYIKKIKGKVF